MRSKFTLILSSISISSISLNKEVNHYCNSNYFKGLNNRRKWKVKTKEIIRIPLQPQRTGLLAATPNLALLILERRFLYTSPPKNKAPAAGITPIAIPAFCPPFNPLEEEEPRVVREGGGGGGDWGVTTVGGEKGVGFGTGACTGDEEGGDEQVLKSGKRSNRRIEMKHSLHSPAMTVKKKLNVHMIMSLIWRVYI